MSALHVETSWPFLAWLLALPVVVALAWRSATALGPAHRGLLVVVRVLLLGAIAAALMRPAVLSRSSEVSVVYALDVSRSVDPGFVEAAIAWMRRTNDQGRPAEARFVAFSDRVRQADTPESIRQLPLRLRGQGPDDGLDPLVTDLEGALDAIAGSFSGDRLRRVVLMTDGLETRGDAWRAVERLRAANIRVFTVPASVRASTDVWVDAVEVPRDLRQDEPTVVNVRLRAQAATNARVSLERGERVLGQRRLRLDAGLNRIPFTIRLGESGVVSLTARVAADGDQIADNDTLTANATVLPRPRVLVVEAAPDSVRHLRDALTAQGLNVDTATPADAPDSSDGLRPYDAVIVSDANGEMLGETRMRALETYVRDQGGGLIYAAGANAYGEAGLRDSPLERVLPATFEAPEKRRDLALVIALDRSYSMKGRKLELAKAATLGALELLEEEHRFGVITFDSQPEITVPLAPVRSKRKAEDLISRFTASGQTNMYPALQMAYRMLVDLPLKAKHVILLSDGDTQPADFQRLARRMGEANITVTTVAIGAEADRTLLENIATWGKGRHYFAESADSVPQIFLQETKRLVNEGLREDPVQAVVKRRVEALRGIDFASAPRLKGVVVTKPRERAEVFLTTDADAALLTRWQVGLGKAALFGSDLKNRWAADWLAWPGYQKFASQLVREVMRRTTREEADFSVAVEGGQAFARLVALTPAGEFRNGLSPKLRIGGLPGEPVEAVMRQAGPGTYELRLPVPAGQSGRLRFELVGGVPVEVGKAAGVRELTPPFPDEFRLAAPDVGLLQALATETGGVFSPQPGQVFGAFGEAASLRHPAWPWLLALGLVLYIADLFLRRSPWVRRRLGS